MREARKRAGLTQAELAARAGTTQSAIARLERGDYAPTLARLTELIRACGFDFSIRLVANDAESSLRVAGIGAPSSDVNIRDVLRAAEFAAAARKSHKDAPKR